MLICGVLAIAAVALAVVIPATGASGDIPPAAQPSGVMPTLVDIGGSNFNCPAGVSTFRVSNTPSSQSPVTYNSSNTASYTAPYVPLPAGVTFTLRGLNGSDKGKWFAYQATGATVFDVAVKGGNDQAWYDYGSNGVSADGATSAGGVPTTSTGLHATKKSDGSFYVASITTFCYTKAATLSGTVYNDLNGNGAKTDTPAELGLSGWVVTAYDSGGNAVATNGPTGTGASGAYSFALPLNATYSVCATPSTGLWALTEPTTTPSACLLSPGGRGWSVDLSTNATKNFGAQSGVQPTCDVPFSGQAYGGAAGNVVYEAQLVPQGTACKDNFVVMYSYLPGTNQLFATLHPPAEGGTDPWQVVEHIRWTGITLDTQNPITLWYDDSYPYDGNPHTDLVPCNSDPRTNPNDFELPASYGTLLPGTETSCILSSTDSAGSGPDNRTYEAWIYSNIDGLRGH